MLKTFVLKQAYIATPTPADDPTLVFSLGKKAHLHSHALQ